MKRVKVTLEDLRFIWSLGFDTGRVFGNKGASWEEKMRLWNEDIKRVKPINKVLYSKLIP